MDKSILEAAYKFTEVSMAGKKRYSGEGFADHGMKVAKILEQFKVKDSTTLVVAVLHHAVANGAATLGDLESEFGVEVSDMVKTLEGLRVIKLGDESNKEFAESLRRMFLVLAKDLRVVLVKLADILDNLETANYLPVVKRQKLAKETLEIFAPLAERLGIGEMKGRMQDLAFGIAYPKEYKEVKRLLSLSAKRIEKNLVLSKEKLKQELKREKIEFRLESRAKHLYSLFTKLKREEIGFDMSKIYDVIAFRIIVGNVEDCYRSLGVIHKLWRPMPDYVRDYIANPKNNGYQSIHTTVFDKDGRPFEVQIRTEAMHQAAEYGVAAHWNYAEVKAAGASDAKLTLGVKSKVSKLDWVQRLAKWQEEVRDNDEFLKSIKTDFFGERIYVFTPKGDVIDLPEGATPVDFAYALHSDLGNLAVGAKVNSKLVSLDNRLKNSDVCEIMIAKDRKKLPNRDWLDFVVSASAKKKIRRALGIR